MKTSLIKYFLLCAVSVSYLGCVNLSSNPAAATSSNEKIEVYKPVSNDTIGYGQTEIIYNLINPSGIKFIELYVNGQFVRNFPPAQNGNKPVIQLNIDSSQINQKISYYLIYYDLNNSSVKSKVMSNILIGEPQIPPSAPYDLTVVQLASGENNISWKDSSTVVDKYEVWRKTGLYGDFALWKTTSEGILSLNDENINPDSIYFYKVRGFNQFGVSGFSTIENSEGVGSTGNLLPPTNLTAVYIDSGKIFLSWQDNSTNENNFEIERRYPSTSFAPLVILVRNSTQFTDSIGVYPGTEFYYKVEAFSDTDTSWSNTVYIKVP